jgi:cyclophilin family peptidyl-prolyl cis-trans isomerase
MAAEAVHPVCEPPEVPHLVLETVHGSIDIELLPAAAPDVVERLVRLSQGPVFHPEIVDGDDAGAGHGYYDGLEFDRAFPHSSLTTALRPPSGSVVVPTRIDADALGLDQRRVTTGSDANRVWQFELFPYQAGIPLDDQLHPRMRQWLARWGETKNADFLIGVSRREIDEALGYRFTDGLDSQPNIRGAVALEPFDRTRSTPRLVILLADAPHFDGRRMVVGRVASGLEVADAISARPLIPAKPVKNRPMVPVRIERADIHCRPPTTGGDGAKGAP